MSEESFGGTSIRSTYHIEVPIAILENVPSNSCAWSLNPNEPNPRGYEEQFHPEATHYAAQV